MLKTWIFTSILLRRKVDTSRILKSGKYLEAMVTVRKHPVSIALSNRVLDKIDKEALKQKRSRSEWVELHFENVFSE